MDRVAVRERGVALVTVIGIMTLMFGASASVIMVLSARARAMTDTMKETGAFYLAEAGIEVSKYEIGKAIDAAEDGIGNVSTETQDGSYAVQAEDLGNNTWRLTSTGVYGDRQVTIEAIVGQSVVTKWPGAAASFVGHYGGAEFRFGEDSNVLIDGGEMPAFSVSSPEHYEIIGTDLATGIVEGNVSPESIVGTGLNTFTVDGVDVELPIQLVENAADSLEDLAGLYDTAVSNVYNTLVPAAAVVIESGSITDAVVYGTAEAPTIVYLTESIEITSTGSITGYGTLVIDGEARLLEGSTLTWNGDIFMVGDDGKQAEINVRGGTLDVTGSLVILGAGDDDGAKVSLTVEQGGSINVDGSFLISTPFSGDGVNKAELSIDEGTFNVQGLFTTLGAQVELVFLEASEVSLHGMWQSAAPPATDENTGLVELTTLGRLEIVFDTEMVETGVSELQDFATDYDLPQIETSLLTKELESYSWQVIDTREYD